MVVSTFRRIQRFSFNIAPITIGTAYSINETIGPLIEIPVIAHPMYLVRAHISIVASSSYAAAPVLRHLYLAERIASIANDKTPMPSSSQDLWKAMISHSAQGTSGVPPTVVDGTLQAIFVGTPILQHLTTRPNQTRVYFKLAVANAPFTLLAGTTITATFDVAY